MCWNQFHSTNVYKELKWGWVRRGPQGTAPAHGGAGGVGTTVTGISDLGGKTGGTARQGRRRSGLKARSGTFGARPEGEGTL